MKKYLLIAITLVISGVSKAQINIVWQKGYGTSQNDSFNNSIELSDGYLHFGTSDGNIEGDKTEISYGGNDIWIIKTDFVGNILWDKTIGGSGSEGGGSPLFINNIIYVLTTSNSPVSGLKTSPSYGGSDYWLLALDLNANILWQKSYGGSSNDISISFNQLNSRQFLLCGTSKSIISGNKTYPRYDIGGDFWPIIVNQTDGQIVRQRVIGTNVQDFGEAIVGVENSIYILGSAGTSPSNDQIIPSAGGKDAWITKLDTNLNVILQNVFGGSDTEGIGEIEYKNNFLYIVANSTSNISGNKTSPQQGTVDPFNNSDIWLVKLDVNLNIIWDLTFGGSANEDIIDLNFINNKILVSSISFSGIGGNRTLVERSISGGPDMWFLVLNEDGSIFDQKTFGGDGWNGAGTLMVNSFGNIIVKNSSNQGISGNHLVPNYGLNDAWVFELSSAFLSVVENQSIVTEVFPNPFSETIQFNLTATNQEAVIEIYTLDGKLCKQERYAAGTQTVSLQMPESGNLLIYKIVSGANEATGKLVRR